VSAVSFPVNNYGAVIGVLMKLMDMLSAML